MIMQSNKQKSSSLPAAIDFGNDYIRVLIGDRQDDDSLVLLGIGESKSKGIKEGKVIDISAATTALTEAIKKAELMAGATVTQVLVGISDNQIVGKNIEEAASISDNNVTVADVDNLRRLATSSINSSNRTVIATLDQCFSIDDNHDISQPVGMGGNRLTAYFYLISANQLSLENIVKCIDNANITLANDFIFSGLASAQSVLSDDEKDLGVCLVDIGAGTTKATVFFDGVVQGIKVWDIASNEIHRDIAHLNHISLKDAERIKKDIGLTVTDDTATTTLTVTGGEEVEVASSVLRDIMSPRVAEIIKDIGEFIEDFEKDDRKISCGIVFVGNGALLSGLVPLTTNQLSLTARIGYPNYRGDYHEQVQQPCYANGLGILAIGLSLHRPPNNSWLGKIAKGVKHLFSFD